MTTNSRIEAIERATGRPWSEWLDFMQRIRAEQLDHHAIATLVLRELEGMVDNLGWWAQSTTVAYEQQIGRRIAGQQPDGTFRLSVSKATRLPMQQLMDAWSTFASHDPAVQTLLTAEPRISGTEKRITWRAKGLDGSAITVISEPKTGGSASLVVQHGTLPTPEASETTKASWVNIVERFLTTLA